MRRRRDQVLIILKTLTAITAYGVLTLAVYRLLLYNVGSTELGLALALTLVQAGLVVILGSTLAGLRISGEAKDRRFEVVGPQIRSALAAHSLGTDESQGAARLAALYPREFDRVFDEVISIVRGDARRRLGRLAEDTAQVRRWVRASSSRNTERRTRAMAALGAVGNRQAIEVLLRALHDRADVVRLEAGLALVRVGGADETEQVFEFALTQNGLIRILIMEALRWRAQFLCKGVLRRYLQSGDPDRITACLETIEAWRVALDLPEMRTVLSHSSPRVRERGFRVLPYLSCANAFQSEILEGMVDPDERVRTAAVFTAGRLKLDAAVPLIESRLNVADGRLALTAAYSLAEIGPRGVDVLERIVTSGGRSSAAALEALERLRTGRFEHANL